MKSLSRYSIRAALALMLATAVGLAAWKAFIWEPPTHRFMLYEKAPVYHGTTATIGPNQICIRSVTRNDRDGGIQIVNGRGQKIGVAVPSKKLISDSGPWLDAVQIDLTPAGDLVDIIEIRIFDHATRELLSTVQPRYGWRLVKPNVIQIYGLGVELPHEIDLWLRVHSYAADDDVIRLSPTKGAEAILKDEQGEAILTINDLQSGYVGWSSGDGFIKVRGKHHAECAIELGWKDGKPSHRHQIAAVTKQGHKLFAGRYYSFAGSGREPIDFHSSLDDVDYFEVRPHGGAHRFFFDGLQLPDVASKAFADPPTATVDVKGKLLEMTPIAEFAPLDIQVMVADGLIYSGSFGGSDHVQLVPHSEGPKEVGQSFSRVIRSRGLAEPPFAFRLRRTGSNVWSAENTVPSRGGFRASTATQGVRSTAFMIPVKEIDAIEIKLLPNEIKLLPNGP